MKISKILQSTFHIIIGWFKRKPDSIKMTKKESKENQMKSDEISDETIMKVLNAIGYEEKSWIQFVREQWNRK
jgi:hypothetical protein